MTIEPRLTDHNTVVVAVKDDADGGKQVSTFNPFQARQKPHKYAQIFGFSFQWERKRDTNLRSFCDAML